MVKEQASTLVSKVGRRYRSNRVDALVEASKIDHVVIGSGIGGLSCAASLAKMGRKVLVLEQHYTAGGFTHSYERNGFEWDVGVHYVGQVGNRLTGPGALFHWMSEGRLAWDSLGEVYDEFIIGGQTYRPPLGKGAYRRFLESHFPNETNAIKQYCHYLFSVERWLPLFFAGKTSSFPGAASIGRTVSKLVPSCYYQTTAEVFNQLTDNVELKAVWSAQWGDLGLPPGQSSFFLHCLIANHYMSGGWYPRGGSSEIARSILPTIEQAGGSVMTYAEVARILATDGAVTGVEMADGYRIACDSVISNCGWFNTQSLLDLPSAKRFSKPMEEKVVESSACHICLYLGFDVDISELGVPKGNRWLHHSADFDQALTAFEEDSTADFPFVYVSSSAARDSTWPVRHPGKSVMELVSVIPKTEFSQWFGSQWGKRDTDYEERKTYWSERLLAVLYQQYPHLKGKVSYYELSTPLSTHHFMKYQDGEIYGLAHTPQRYLQKGLKPKTEIAGLFLTGQDALTSGVVGAAMSGVFSAAEVLGDTYKRQLWRGVKGMLPNAGGWRSMIRQKKAPQS
ncbi:phytoene desaturase family protein [Litoribrevibacter albus]|uniref:Phytoene dehydrogenase n=1 Tax=Litoribrevibacter albus TaxID=1473156 RepID=A0AA37SFY7_9GAMM|nr:NAD(P)/FAD-dependent oxidoreductase [Litoribrevibacter albus]GLQ33636.1 phytoene dehydrogenase [Litoribrevibacter albus]